MLGVYDNHPPLARYVWWVVWCICSSCCSKHCEKMNPFYILSILMLLPWEKIPSPAFLYCKPQKAECGLGMRLSVIYVWNVCMWKVDGVEGWWCVGVYCVPKSVQYTFWLVKVHPHQIKISWEIGWFSEGARYGLCPVLQRHILAIKEVWRDVWVCVCVRVGGGGGIPGQVLCVWSIKCVI